MELLSKVAAGRVVGCSRWTIARWVQRGHLRVVVANGVERVDRASLEAYIRSGDAGVTRAERRARVRNAERRGGK